MIVNPIENTSSPAELKDKVDSNLIQQKTDTNLSQKQEENKTENQEDPNWKAFREARKKDKADKEAAERRAAEKEAEATALKAAMEAAFSKNNVVQNNQNDFEQIETEEERIDKRVQAIIEAREKQSEKARHEREKNELPQRLLHAFPDYNEVVNEENGTYLEYHHPELYRSLLRQPENFETCSDIYKVVKKFVPNSTTSKKEAIRAENNFNKPKSISSATITQPGQVTSSAILTEDKRQQNWERMQRILKGVS